MGLIKKISEYAVLLFFIIWFFTIVVDFSNVKKEKQPLFCLRTKVYTYDDGKVKECLGMGYKVFTYERDSLDNLMEFVPSWQLPKESNVLNEEGKAD